jgi:hypothetical protein
MKLSRNTSLLPDQFEIADDFLDYIDLDMWTKIDADAGASTAQDADGVGGLILLTTGATDNNECYLHTTNELFKVVADKEIDIECRLQFTEANTDDANVIFGLMDAVAANHLIDDGAGPVATYDGAVLYKVDGGTVWVAESSNAGTQVTNTTKTTAGGTAYQTLRIRITPRDATDADVTFFVDGQQCEDTNQNAGQPFITQTLTLSGLAEMALVVGAKAGGANSEVVTVDYIRAAAVR